MKKTNTLLICLAYFLLTSCNNKNNNNEVTSFMIDAEQISLLNDYNNQRNSLFIKRHLVDKDYKFVSRPLRIINEKADSIVSQIDNGNYDEKLILSFFNYCEDVIIQHIHKPFNLNKELPDDKIKLVSKIKLYQYISSNMIIDKHQNIMYSFSQVGVKIVPEKNNFKIGEEYRADIYLVANNFNKPFKVIVDDKETISDPSDVISFAKYKCVIDNDSRNKNGVLIIPAIDTIPFDFSIDVK